MNDWIKTIAPLIGTALGGPLGGAAASFIADKLGVNEKTVEAVSKVLNDGKLSPEQIVQVKDAELEFKKFLETNKIKLEELAQQDRKSARDMLIATRAKTPAILTWIIVLAVLGLEGFLLVSGTPDNIDPLVMGRIMGTLDMALGLVLAYWFGTTSGSTAKTELLANSMPVK